MADHDQNQDDDDDDSKVRAPLDRFKDFEPSAIATAPDGGIAPGPIGLPVSIPSATPANFVCLRGPCRSYWELQTFFASGNPAETWGPDGLKDPDTGAPLRAPRQISRTCITHPGTETELTDDNVYECSRWDPLTPREVKQRDKRRSRYFKANPSHRPPGA